MTDREPASGDASPRSHRAGAGRHRASPPRPLVALTGVAALVVVAAVLPTMLSASTPATPAPASGDSAAGSPSAPLPSRSGSRASRSDATRSKGLPARPGPSASPTRPAPAWRLPVATSKINSGFRSDDRPDHDGLDFGAPRGATILAAAAGTVLVAECSASNGDCDVDGSLDVTGCGWFVEIRHAGGIVTRSCHMLSRPLVRVGQQVVAGQPIGRVGSSGNSTGPHLHFEVHTGYPADSDNAIDPLPFLRKRGVAV